MTIDGWTRRTLAQVVAPHDGLIIGPFGSQLHASDYIADGIPVVMPKDLVNGTIRPSKTARISETKALELARHRLRPGDVVVARRGELGRCAFVETTQQDWLCGTGCLRLRLGESVDARFLVQYLRWPRIVAWLEAHAVGQTMANLNRRTLEKLPLILPPLAEQRRIRRVLEAIDQHRASLVALRRAESALQQGVLERLLQVPRKTPGWSRRPLGELATFGNGHRFRSSEWSDVGLPILRIQNLRGSSNFKRFAGYAKDAWWVEEGELLFAWAGTRGSLGPFIWRGPRGVLNQHIFRVRPHPGIDKTWLFEVLQEVTRAIESRAHGFKSTLLHLRKGHVTGRVVAVPPLAVQQRIAEESKLLSRRLMLFDEQLAGLLEIKKGLMEDLFLGRRSHGGGTLEHSLPELESRPSDRFKDASF